MIDEHKHCIICGVSIQTCENYSCENCEKKYEGCSFLSGFINGRCQSHLDEKQFPSVQDEIGFIRGFLNL